MSNPPGDYSGAHTHYTYGPPQGQDQNYPPPGYSGTPGQPPADQYQYPPYQQSGPGQYGGPPQGYPPQQPAPPPSQGYPGPQYPPQYPSQDQPPQGQGAQQAPPVHQGYPPQQYPPQYPPQQPPPQSQYMSAPPQGQYPPHPQQPYPPQGQPPYQQQQPHQQPYGAPQHQVQPAPPSAGYDPNQRAQGDAKHEAEELRKAMKGFGTDEKRLINVLYTPDPLRMALIRHAYTEHIGRNLESDVKSETSGNLESGLMALLSGPLGMDVRHLNMAISGAGTNEDALDDILLLRSNADMKAIKAAYVRAYKKSLESELKSDLSGNTEKLFLMLLDATRAEPGTPFDQQSVDNEAREIHHATQARAGTDEISVSSIFVNATEAKLCAICDQFEKQYHTSLDKVINEEFSGHMRNALLSMMGRARNPAKGIAVRMNAILRNPGHDRLIYWLVKLHWDKPLFEAVKAEFQKIATATLRTQVHRSLPDNDVSLLLQKLVD